MIISKNSNYYIYKYIKYKNKYINLKNNYQQDGGEVLSIISKSNFETLFNLDFEYASKMELIDSRYNIDDNTAIEFMRNYDDYVEELEQEEQENAQREQSGEIQVDNVENQQVQIGGEEDGEMAEESGESENSDYIYPNNEEEDDAIDSLRQIDITTWEPSNTQKNQYYLVKIINDDNNYLLKLVSSDFKYEFKKNMEDYDVEYGKLKSMKNILSPQFLFKDNNNIVCGYLFKFDEEFINLNSYLKSDDFGENELLELFNKISDCFISVLRCGLKPCVKNNGIMVLKSDDNIQVLLTGADGLLNCKQDIEEETIRDIVKFINVDDLSTEIKDSYTLKKIFKLSESGLSLKNNIATVRGFKELIEKMSKK
jgi:hypothetical protein